MRIGPVSNMDGRHLMELPGKETTSLISATESNRTIPKKWYKSRSFYLNLVRSCVAELVATALYVFVGATSVSNFIGTNHPHLPTTALTFGFSYAGLSAAMNHVSGGHINPAITLGVCIAGGINVVTASLYIIAQIFGGILGAACIMVYDWDANFSVSQENTNSSLGSAIQYSATLVYDEFNPGLAIFIEMMLTLMLVIVFIHTSMERPELRSTSPALCGLTLAAGILGGYRLTGGSLNPARSFGPCIVSGDDRLWKDHYVYWIGPLCGGALAGLLYRFILASKPLLPLTKKESLQTNNNYS